MLDARKKRTAKIEPGQHPNQDRRPSGGRAVRCCSKDPPVEPGSGLLTRSARCGSIVGACAPHANKPSMSEPGRIPEWRDVDAATFRDEIVPGYRPAVLRGLVAHWPAVQRARTSIQSIGQYLSAFDKGGAVDVIIMPPHV